MFQFLLSQAQDRYTDMNYFFIVDYKIYIMTLKGKYDITEVVDIECDNGLSKFASYFYKALERIFNKKCFSISIIDL